MATLGAGCAPEGAGPTGPATSTTPEGTSASGNTALIGEWQAVTLIGADSDVVSTTTLWRFNGDGSCRKTVTTVSAAEGIPRVSAADCTFTAGPASVTVSFAGQAPATFTVLLTGVTPDQMVLDGLAYQRVD